MLIETSSAPGGSTLDVGPRAAAFAEPIVAPTPAKSDAAAATCASAAFTYDICTPQPRHGGQPIARQQTADWANQIVGWYASFCEIFASFAAAKRTRPGLPRTAIRAL